MDTQDDPEGRKTTTPTGYQDQRQHGRPSTERHGLFVARQSQGFGIGKQESASTTSAQPAVPIHQPEAQGVCLSGKPHYQRGHEKEGKDREIQKSWSILAARGASCE